MTSRASVRQPAVGEVGDRLGAAGGRVDGPALGREPARGLVADARRAAGDQHGSGVFAHLVLLAVCWTSLTPTSKLRADASGHLPGAGRGARRRRARARADRARRGDRPGRGERRLRLGPPHLPRPGRDRAGLHDRPRVRRHGGRGRRRRQRGRRGRPRARHLLHRLRRVLLLRSAATSTSAITGASSATARRSARCRAPRPSCCWSRTPTSPCAGCPRGCPTTSRCSPATCMGTGYHAVVETGVGPGSSVAVLGLGPVGLCAVQAALAAGAERVIAVDTVARAARDGARRSAPSRSTSPRRTRAPRSRRRPRGAASTRRSTRSATPTRSSSPAG